MFVRALNGAGLLVRIAEAKATLIGLIARRSAMVMLGYLIAAIIALAGLAVLLGAGYISIEAIVGAPAAMAAIGVFLLLLATLIWAIAYRRGRGTGGDHGMSEGQARLRASADAERLRSMLGVPGNDAKPDPTNSGPRSGDSTQQHRKPSGLSDSKVALAAGFALLGLLGPVRLLRTVRIATALASVTALANRAINEHRDGRSARGAP